MPDRPGVDVVVRPDVPGTLGRLRMAGRIEGGKGLGERRLRTYPEYALMYVTAGRGTYRDVRRPAPQPVPPGTLAVIVPGVPHWYGPAPGETWDETFLVFDGPVFDLARAQGLLDGDPPLRPLLPVRHWAPRIDAFRQARAPRSRAGVDDEACRVLRLLVEVLAAAPVAGCEGTGPDWLAESRSLLEADLDAPLDLATVAARVGMAYETWRKRFAERQGIAPARYRSRHRIAVAAELLRSTRLTNAQVATATGYTDEHHFSRRFREATGMPPTAYRRWLG